MIIVIVMSFLLAAIWLPLARRSEPTTSFFIPRYQRWSTYGKGALALSLGYAGTGVIVTALWLLGGH